MRRKLTMKKLLYVLSLLVIASMVLTACGPAPAATEPAATEPAATEPPAEATEPPAEATEPPAGGEPTAVPTATFPPPVLTGGEGCDANATRVTWFIGLGTGSQPNDVEKERAWVDAYNASQTEACIIMNVVFNQGQNSYDALRALIAGGNAPDIVGPVGKAGRASFQGAWADITPLAEAAGYDLSQYDPALLEFTKDEGVLVGLPFALFPSFIFYNKKLFDEAQLPYPPHKVGEQYDGKEWNFDTLRELGMKLTVDANGNDATSPDFDPNNVVQFGFFEQWTDARGVGSLFGGGIPYDEADPTKAVIPEHWIAAWKWYYDGIWKDHFIPTNDYANSDQFGKGNVFSSGNLAMSHVHTWYTCCFDNAKLSWDIAVVPSYNGVTTAKLHGDTFAIMEDSKNKEVAFKVLSDMIVAPELYVIYGGMPAKVEDRPAFFEAKSEAAAPNTIDWSVAEAMLAFPDLPNHEAWLPNLAEANPLLAKLYTDMGLTPDLNIDEAAAQLQADLEAAYQDAAP
jgi:multiple sugar transport system substrate-binding protein